MSVLIQNGTIVTDQKTFKSDIYIKDEIIEKIAPNIDPFNIKTVINAKGKYIFPGGVDVHTHFELPVMGTTSSDDFETGTIAALFGGTTTIIDFVTPQKGESLLSALDKRLKLAQKSTCDFGFHMCLVEYNKKIAAEIPIIIKSGITSFKCFMSYKDAQLSDIDLQNIFKEVSKHGALPTVHAELGDMINKNIKAFLAQGKTDLKYHYFAHMPETESLAIQKIAKIAKKINTPVYIVHLSSAHGLDTIIRAKRAGCNIIAETCPQYLVLNKELYDEKGLTPAKYICSPPLRPKTHLIKLWKGIKDGHIKTIATDHCPFNFHGQKDVEKNNFTKVPNGLPAIEDRLKLMYTYGVFKKRIKLNKLVQIFSTNPAKLFGLYPKKGTIIVGSDADLVIFDPKIKSKISRKKQHQNVDYNAFEGFNIIGMPETILLRGKFAIKNNKYVAEQKKGVFLKRKLPNYT